MNNEACDSVRMYPKSSDRYQELSLIALAFLSKVEVFWTAANHALTGKWPQIDIRSAYWRAACASLLASKDAYILLQVAAHNSCHIHGWKGLIILSGSGDSLL